MPAPTLAGFSRLLLAIYRLAQEKPVAEFQDAVLEAIKPVLPFDASTWGTATMTPQGVDIHGLHRHRFPDDMFAAFDRVKHQDTAAQRVTGQPRMTIGFSAIDEFSGPGQAEIRRFAQEWSQHHCFITSDIHPVTRFVHWISLFRSDPDQPCRPEEVEMLAELAPHLMQAVAINRLVHLDRMLGDAARESWSVAIADARGVLYHADPRFRELFGGDWPLAQDRVPADFLATLRDEVEVAGVRAVVQAKFEHGLFFLKARRKELVDTLSPREFVVARLLASGMTQKEVASKLERSPGTVQAQAKSIFAKLGINSVALLGPLLVLRQ